MIMLRDTIKQDIIQFLEHCESTSNFLVLFITIVQVFNEIMSQILEQEHADPYSDSC